MSAFSVHASYANDTTYGHHTPASDKTTASVLVCCRGPATMHDFKIGQYVYYVPRKVEGRFVVMKLLPQPKREPRYVIRSEAEPEREYTAEASELRRVQSGR